MNTLARRLDARLRAELAGLGLDLSSFATVMTLLDEEGIIQTELSAAVGVKSYSTTRMLDKMEEQGLDAPTRKQLVAWLQDVEAATRGE